jgi:hypothetical protein
LTCLLIKPLRSFVRDVAYNDSQERMHNSIHETDTPSLSFQVHLIKLDDQSEDCHRQV